MKKILICLGAALFLAGCAAGNAVPEELRDKTFIDQLAEQDLKQPERIISSQDEFRYALDWLAFYRIADTVWFSVDDTYADSFFNPYTEFQKAYTSADLADVYACQMDDTYYSDYGVIGIHYSMSKDIASRPPQEIPDLRVVPSFDYRQEGNWHYEADPRKPQAACENSEQLYYLVMNGYEPLCKEGSTAEQIYEEAKAVLSSLIKEDMNDFEMIKAVYDWLTTEVVYDQDTAYARDTYLVREQAYYLEGVFLNHCAVCDGKAKAYALLLNMLDIPCYRTTGVSSYGDHAWNMVCLKGKWYISCTTYGQKTIRELNRIVPDYSILLTDDETSYGEEWEYVPQKHLETASLLESEPYDIYAAISEADHLSLKVKNIEEAEALLEEIEQNSEREYKVEFLYTGEEAEQFEEELIRYLEGKENINAIPVRSKGGKAYAVICLKES